MAEKDFRVLLDVSDLHLENFKYIWVNVSPYELKTILDLKKYILHKINLEPDIQLFVRNGLLLDNETIGILREDDTVKIKFKPPMCQNLEKELLKEGANFSLKRNFSDINISNENINLKRHKPDFITLSFNGNRDNFSEKKSKKEKRLKQAVSPKDPEHYFCSTSVEKEQEEHADSHLNFNEKNQIHKKKRNLIESDVSNENASFSVHKSQNTAVSSNENEDNFSGKKSKKRKRQTELLNDPEHCFSTRILNSKTIKIPSISSENLCSTSIEAEKEQLEIVENVEINAQNSIEGNKTQKMYQKKKNKKKSPILCDQTVTNISLCNTSDLSCAFAVDFNTPNRKKIDKSLKSMPSDNVEYHTATTSNNSSKAEQEKFNFNHNEPSGAAVNDMDSVNLIDKNVFKTKTKRKRRRRRKKSSAIVEGNCDVNLINSSKSYSDKIDEDINRKHVLYLSPDKNAGISCLDDASEIHNLSSDTFVTKNNELSSVSLDYPKMSTPMVILKSNFLSNESSVIVKNNLDVDPIDSSKSHSDNVDEDINRENILHLNSNRNQQISCLNNSNEINNCSPNTFSCTKDKFSSTSLSCPEMSTPAEANCSVVPDELSLMPSKNCNLPSDNNEPVFHDESATKNRKKKSKKISYEDLPDVTSIPDVGTCIAYKVLELAEDYSPSLTDYRVGVIERIDFDSDEVEIRLDKEIILPGRVGKFENLKEGEVPEPIIKTHDVLKWCNVASPKLMSPMYE